MSVLSRYEYIKKMSFEQMQRDLLAMFIELCEDGIPTEETVGKWLAENIQHDSNFEQPIIKAN